MSPDFLDLLRALLGAEARFLVVGAYAVGVHGHPRATKDLADVPALERLQRLKG
jgi:hypothetical protein